MLKTLILAYNWANHITLTLLYNKVLNISCDLQNTVLKVFRYIFLKFIFSFIFLGCTVPCYQVVLSRINSSITCMLYLELFFFSTLIVLVYSSLNTKCYRLSCLNGTNLFLTVLEVRESKIKVPDNLVPGGVYLPGLQKSAFCCVLTW